MAKVKKNRTNDERFNDLLKKEFGFNSAILRLAAMAGVDAWKKDLKEHPEKHENGLFAPGYAESQLDMIEKHLGFEKNEPKPEDTVVITPVEEEEEEDEDCKLLNLTIVRGRELAKKAGLNMEEFKTLWADELEFAFESDVYRDMPDEELLDDINLTIKESKE